MPRLFFALWPDDAVRTALAEAQRAALPDGPRAVPVANLHITLAFLGTIDAATTSCVEQAAAGVRATRFSLSLEELGWWRRTGIVWLGPRSTPDPLKDLQIQLSRALTACGIAPETRAFEAHMTLARRARRPPREVRVRSVEWHVAEFYLVQSVTDRQGAQYAPLRSWPLAVPAG